jgi:hypothetical protein
VTYVPGGAAQALGEVKAAADACAGKSLTRQSSADSFVTTVTPVTFQGLLPRSVVVQIRELDKRLGKVVHEETVFAVYQYSGNALSAVYVHAVGPTAIGLGRVLAAKLALTCRKHLQAQLLAA